MILWEPQRGEQRTPLVPSQRHNKGLLRPQGELLPRQQPCSLKEATAFPSTLFLSGWHPNASTSSSSSWADEPQPSHPPCVSVFLFAERIIKFPSAQECCSFNSLISIRSLEVLSRRGSGNASGNAWRLVLQLSKFPC